jgi:hypothetical protein
MIMSDDFDYGLMGWFIVVFFLMSAIALAMEMVKSGVKL